jgi:ABC-type Zn uptake system ZnuABC Zn-binding protein ZnuA
MPSNKKPRLRTPVAAVLAASLTAASVVHAATTGDPTRLEHVLELHVIASIAREVARDERLARAVTRSLELHAEDPLPPVLDPASGRAYAQKIEARLRRIDASRAALWERNRRAFEARLEAAEAGLALAARPLAGVKLVAASDGLAPFARAHGAEVVATIAGARADDLERLAREKGVRAVLVRSREPRGPADELARRVGVRVSVLPSDVGEDGIRDWVELQQRLVERVADALRGSRGLTPSG